MSSVIMPTSGIHETAIIHPSAKIGKDVSVGPYAVIDEDTEIGDGCVIGAHVTIHPYTKIGKNCHFFPGCSIGAVPQDLKFVGEKSYTIIGDGGSFRECCTVHRACGEGNETRIGNNILMMAYTHVAHNCIVGNNVIMSNVATLAGHVIVEDRAVIGGLSAVHQFCKIGRNVMIGGMARVTQDVDPVFPTGEMCLNRPMILIINQVIQPFIIPLDREIIHPFQIIIKPGGNLVRTHRRDLLRHRDPNIRRLVHIGIR